MFDYPLAFRLSKFDYPTGVLLQNIAAGCIDKVPGINLPRLVVRSPSVTVLLYSGFIDETIGDYIHVDRLCSKADISSALLSHGFDVPKGPFSRSGHWVDVYAYLQSVFLTSPDDMQELFSVIDGSMYTYENARKIDRILTRQLWY